MRNSNTCRSRSRLGYLISETVVAGLALLCLAARANAVDPFGSASQYAVESWRNDRGFPARSVTAIAQTRDGYLWIGTDNGLVRFDGLNFRLYDQANPGAFSIGGVQALEADGAGNLWVLLQNTRILRYHDGEFEPGRDLVEFGVTAIGKRRDGAILLSSLSSGILVNSGGTFKPLPSASGDSIASNRSRFYAKPSSALTLVEPPDQSVTSVEETADGTFWMGTKANGLFQITGNQLSPVGRGLATSTITCLTSLENGDLWIGTDRGIKIWTGNAFTTAGVPTALRDSNVHAMIRDRNSNTWVGTSRGLFVLDENAVHSGQIQRVGSRSVTALFEDREGDLWVGGPQGIEHLHYKPFFTYTGRGLQSESSGQAYVDRDSRVWFAPAGGGLRWFQEGMDGTVTDDNLNNDVVYSITGSDNEVWVGRQRGGLTLLHFKDGATAVKTYRQADGLAQDSIYTVYRSRDGTVWAGTLTGGVTQIRQGRLTTYTTANGLSSNTVTSITEDSDGEIWFATPNGLSALSRGQWRHFAVSNGLPSPVLNCLLSDSTGVLWIGSANGLAYMSSDQIRVPLHLPEALREQIFGIAEDRSGWLWISTSGHILRVDRKALLEGRLGEGDVHEYGSADGLLGTEGIKRDRSIFADPRGRVWLSTNRGLSVVDPSRLMGVIAPVLVHIDALSADGSAFSTEAPIQIPSSRQRITLSFLGLSFSNTGRVRYRYRLDGFDHNWSDPVAARSAEYTNLRPGPYRFRVIACNSDGIWNYTGATLDFIILPAYYQTGWFMLLCVLLAAGALWTLYLYRLRLATGQIQQRLGAQMEERERIARELHDTLLQGFQGLMLRFQAVNRALPNDDPTRQMIEKVLDRGDQVLLEGRQRIRELRAEVIGGDDLPNALATWGEELAKDHTAEFSVSVVGSPQMLNPVVCNEVYRIAQEALSNAFHHSQASKIEIELTFTGDRLSLRIRDDGKGIGEDILSTGRIGHWGLSGMRERAQKIGADLTVWSSAGSGTEIDLKIPSRVAYPRSNKKSPWDRVKRSLRKRG